MKRTMIKAGVVGATGYAGSELVRLLCRHPMVRLVSVGSRSYAGKPFSDVYPNMKGICDLV
ncbi:MAG: N-acetyl-gamma-glutamyl-phosphate reductase, partial [Sphaerochaetaceae bacterium]